MSLTAGCRIFISFHTPNSYKVIIPRRISYSSQKIKIMFHVFQVVSLGFSRNFSKFYNLHREEARNFPMSLRLYKQLPGHSSTEKAMLSPRSNTLGEARNFPMSQSLYGGRARNFSKSQTLYKVVRDRNFSESQSLYRGGSGKMKKYVEI